MKKKIFLICPVRGASEEHQKSLLEHVTRLENAGHQVHYPARDTEQIDPTGGYIICSTNFQKILDAQEIHVWYSPESMGSHFDIGVVFALAKVGFRKKIVVVNRSRFIEDLSSDKKSFIKVVDRLRSTSFEN